MHISPFGMQNDRRTAKIMLWAKTRMKIKARTRIATKNVLIKTESRTVTELTTTIAHVLFLRLIYLREKTIVKSTN